MRIFTKGRLMPVVLFSIPLAFMGCNSSSSSSDDGGGGGDGGGSTTESSARISGSVSLSSSVAGSNKPGSVLLESAADALQFKASATRGIQVLNKPDLSSATDAVTLMAVGDAVSNAFVYLYDAEHPEWLGPVAQDITDSDGGYEFDAYGCTDRVSTGSCSSDAATNGDAYVDGDPLPFGVYTMLIYKPSTFDPISGVTTDPIVSVLPAFKAEDEDLVVEEAEAEVSDVTPNVVTMFGLEKNTDGTDTWGSAATELPGNTAIQITFDMAMSRGSVQNITVSDGSAVSGKWSLSPDWMTATFEPDSALTSSSYTVTVPSTTVNVYSNAMGYRATGTFSAVAVDSTAPTVSVTSPATATGVEATTPIRITSNEVLKTNALRVESTPSLGDFPSMILVDSDGSSFVYEVVTTQALQLGETYAVDFSGIQDGAGNTAADLRASFTVQGASDAEGVDSSATSETQSAQVAISEIFAKWVRAINERNPATIQSLMSGSFVFEYSVQAEDGFRDEDVNRNGRLSLKEFMAMISHGMVNWEYCDTTVTGDIVDSITLSSATAGSFEFTLNFASDNTSQQCNDDGAGSLYATVKNVNGLWKVARMSEDYDHRGTTLASYDLIEAALYETADNADGEALVPNWDVLENFADNETPLTFKFEHVTGVESYVFLLVNERDPSELGFAMAISADRLACGDDTDCSATEGDDLELTVPDPFGDDGLPTGAYPVSEIFGFDSEREWGIGNPGEVFMWEVLGMTSLSAIGMAEETPSAVEFIRDLAAVSAVKRFQNPGDYVELGIDVEGFDFGVDEEYGGGDDVSLGMLQYDIYKNGFDAGAGDFIRLTLTSPDEDGQLDNAKFRANSHIGFAEYDVTFTANGDGTASATADVQLYQGWTWVEVSNGVNRWEEFQVMTTGGKGPDITVSTIEAFDSTPTSLGSLTLDVWNFADASSDALSSSEGAVTLDVTWSLADGIANSDGVGGDFDLADVIDMLTTQNCNASTGWANMHINVWNDSGAYDQFNYCSQDGSGPTGDISISGSVVSVSDLEVFGGDNWVSLNVQGNVGTTGTSSNYETQSSFGVYTDTGSTFVAPITLASITTSEGVPDEIGSWGQGSDWDASDVTTATSELTLVFNFGETPTSPMIQVGADGICCTNETLTDSGGGDYEYVLTLYQGYNWINVNDGSGNWYNLNIYTESGAELPKPKFLTANGEDIPEAEDKFQNQEVVVEQCTVTVTGTVPENTEMLRLNWNGGNSTENYWEGQELLFDADTGSAQSWSATFQLFSGEGAYNKIEAWDETNSAHAGLEVATSAPGCTYSLPELTVDGVRIGSATGTNLVDVESGSAGTAGGIFALDANSSPVTNTSVWVYGTSTIPGRSIFVDSQFCGQQVKVSGTAGTTSNTSGTYDWAIEVGLYDDNELDVDNMMVYAFYQNMHVSDGQSWQNVTVISDSNEVLSPAMTLTLPSNMDESSSQGGQAGCANAMWEANPDTETSVTIAGNTTNEDAWGEYGSANFASSYKDFAIGETGDFSFAVDLLDGYNNIWVSDNVGGYYNIQIMTANGVTPPQFVYVESYAIEGGTSGDLTTTSEGIVGDVTISGGFGDSGFVPEWLNARVSLCDGETCVDLQYDSTLQVANDFAQPMTYNNTAPASGFSLDVTIPENTGGYVEVWGCSKDGGCHGHGFGFNDGMSDDGHFYKPSAGDSANHFGFHR